MKDIAITFEDGKGVVNWERAAYGAEVLRQRIICSVMSDRGTDVLTGKGSDYQADLFALSTYDTANMQHAVNFAVVEASKQVRKFVASDAAEDTLGAVKGVVLSVDIGRRVSVGFSVKNLAGQLSSTRV
jgi:hypothetical protein